MGSLDVVVSQFAAAADPCRQTFLGLVPWNQYLIMDQQCRITNFTVLGGNSSLLLILLAIVDDLLRIAGLLAVILIIYSGVKFIMSQGSPDQAAKARGTVINALIGLAITLISIAFVSYLGDTVGTGTGAQGNPDQLDLSSLPNPGGVASGAIIPTVLSVVFIIMGALAALIIVIAGYRYILAQGDPQATTQAKNTIIYALIGLAVAITAQSIVSVVLNR